MHRRAVHHHTDSRRAFIGRCFPSVSELSRGASLRANQALLVHNSRTAGLIARELTGLSSAVRTSLQPID